MGVWDEGSGGGAGSTSDSGAGSGGVIGQFVGALISRYGIGTQGTGKMAARGQAAAAAKLQSFSIGQALLGEKLTQAYRSFAASEPEGTQGILVDMPVVNDPKLQKWAQKLIGFEDAGKTGKARRIEAKIDKRTAKLAPQAQYRVVHKYGLASGPPLAGSRDDPEGQLVIRHAWSQ